MGKRGDEADRVGDLLSRAETTCRRLSEALTRMIEAFASDFDNKGDGDAKSIVAALQAHQKALQTVLDYEVRLEQHIAERNGAGTGEIDVESARREVLGQLSRLAERN